MAAMLCQQERPSTLARFLVTKHSWRGRYRRIMGVAEDGLYTLNPQTLETTNVWSYASDLVGVGLVDGSEEDFHLTLTQDPDGLIKLSFGAHKKLWSCEHRAELLTAVQRARSAAAARAPLVPRARAQVDPHLMSLRLPAARIDCVAPDATPVWAEIILVATVVSLELRDPESDRLLDDLPYASLRGLCAFCDLPGGFLVQRRRRPRAEAFRCAQLAELLRHVLAALARLGASLALGQGLPVPAAAAAAAGARVSPTPPTPLGVWCSARAADDASYRPHQLRCDAYRVTPLGPLAVTLLVTDDEVIERVRRKRAAAAAPAAVASGCARSARTRAPPHARRPPRAAPRRPLRPRRSRRRPPCAPPSRWASWPRSCARPRPPLARRSSSPARAARAASRARQATRRWWSTSAPTGTRCSTR